VLASGAVRGMARRTGFHLVTPEGCVQITPSFSGSDFT
jgi:hypothetical protein